MKDLFFSKQAKVIVDLLLILGLILLLMADCQMTSTSYWISAHCIIGSVLVLLIAVHIAQNWRMIKAFTKRKVILKNKVTTVIILCSLLLFISIISFIDGTSLLKLHNVVGHLFILIVIIHVIDRAKRFISLFRR